MTRVLALVSLALVLMLCAADAWPRHHGARAAQTQDNYSFSRDDRYPTGFGTDTSGHSYGISPLLPRLSGRGVSLGSLPFALSSKAQEIVSACGSTIISACRPGARVRGSGHSSLHASCRAVDIKGNPSCIYSHLASWPGGVSTDYSAVGHVHFSYAPGGAEWGARFAHHGGGRHHYAHRHHRQRLARG